MITTLALPVRFYSIAAALVLVLTMNSSAAQSQYRSGISGATSGGGFSHAAVYANITTLGQIASPSLESAHYRISGGSLAQFVPSDDTSCGPTRVSLRMIGSGEVRLTWNSCPEKSYRIEWTADFRTWQSAPAVVTAPPGGGLMNYMVPVTRPSQFFRIVTQ